jgi:hypothetical protein
MLLRVIAKYFANSQHQLERHFERVLSSGREMNCSHERIAIEEIEASIRELNRISLTTDNMFDVLEKVKLIELEIRELDPSCNDDN